MDSVMQKLAVGVLAAAGVAGLATAGTAQAGPVPTAGVRVAGWASVGCVPVSVTKYSDGSVWGIENCNGLEQRVLLGHSG